MNEHQKFEREWHGDCCWTYGEETKQLVYAEKMGLTWHEDVGRWPVFDVGGRAILDIGGGPCSLLLKTSNLGVGTVVDPCPYPAWVRQRYAAHGIELVRKPAERFLTLENVYDEVWIYNVLQHVEDPAAVLAVACRAAPVVRLFEWVYVPPHLGHPHMLTPGGIDYWLGYDMASPDPGRLRGTVESLNDRGCVGTAYYGVFET